VKCISGARSIELPLDLHEYVEGKNKDSRKEARGGVYMAVAKLLVAFKFTAWPPHRRPQ
jgi:hypothetical protein